MAQSVEGIMSEPLKDTLEDVVEETGKEQSVASFGDGTVQLLLLVDLKSALNYLRETSGGTREMGGMGDTIDIDTSSTPMAQQESGSESQGRGTLTRLFLIGAVVGLGYVLRRRMSVDEVVDQASQQAEAVADRTSERTSAVAERTNAVADEAADTVQEGSERAADSIESTGENAADEIESTGDTAAEEIDTTGDATAEEVEEMSEEMEERADDSSEDTDDEEYE